MAKLEKTLSGNFNQLLNKIEDGILNGVRLLHWKTLAIFKAEMPDVAFGFLNAIVMLAETV